MKHVPEPIQRVISAFDQLPGIGPRAASRFAYWLIGQPKDQIQRFAKALLELSEHVRTCDTCHQWSDQNPCGICRDPQRDGKTTCIVAYSPAVKHIVDTGVFSVKFHVLGGTIVPL